MIYFQEESKASSRRLKIEKLPPWLIESIPSSVQPPKLDLKLLRSNIKYSFLKENKTFLIINSSKLNVHKKCKLLPTLKIHKNTLGLGVSIFSLVWLWAKKIHNPKSISSLNCKPNRPTSSNW